MTSFDQLSRKFSRFQAAGIHLLLSLCLLAIVSFFVFEHWYPGIFFHAEGSQGIYMVVIAVYLILGPGLMLIVYVPGKKGLAFDLAFVPALQLAALIYGTSVLYAERPQFVVFSVDRFVLVSGKDINTGELNHSQLPKSRDAGPQLTFALMPTDPGERSRLLEEALQGGPDLEFRPQYYRSYSDHLPNVISKALSLKQFAGNIRKKIERFKHNHCLQQQCVFLPLVGKKKDALLAIYTTNGQIAGGLDINPWQTR